MTNYLIALFVLIYEISVRITPTEFNISILDKVKNIMLMFHNLVDIMIPNKKIDEEK